MISKEDLDELQVIAKKVVTLIQTETNSDVGKSLFIMDIVHSASREAYEEYKKRTGQDEAE